jgi:hypothetical protein
VCLKIKKNLATLRRTPHPILWTFFDFSPVPDPGHGVAFVFAFADACFENPQQKGLMNS